MENESSGNINVFKNLFSQDTFLLLRIKVWRAGKLKNRILRSKKRLFKKVEKILFLKEVFKKTVLLIKIGVMRYRNTQLKNPYPKLTSKIEIPNFFIILKTKEECILKLYLCIHKVFYSYIFNFGQI